MIRSVALLMVVSGPSAAETARVYSGEHDGFTRLVVELPIETEWTVGRAAEGYAFAILQTAQPEYDTSGVWQRISRARVSALQIDPETGALLISLGCDCHVFPFEYRAGAVVLDVKPGPPPEGSAFEMPFEGSSSRPVAGETAERATPGVTFNWLNDLPTASVRPPPTLPLPLATGEVSLDPLRNALLEQIARGAADGLVDMGRPMPRTNDVATKPEELPWSSVMLGEQPGIQVNDPDAFIPGAEPTGSCPNDELLNIAAWGGEGSPLDLLASARTGLYGEFDVAEPGAIQRSVRSHLYLGFGAEAEQLADLAGPVGEDDVLALYRSMARTIDGDTDPGTPFAQMLDCDGLAALWAALARDRLPAGQGLNREAVLRSFLALPPHLRAHLGSGLAEKFLALNDPEAVRTIRDAMERTPHVDTAAIALLDAERELHQGNADAALSHAEDVVSQKGNAAEGFVALVEAHFQKLAPIGPEVAEALISGQGETGESDHAGNIERAIILSLALSGQMDAAFGRKGAVDSTLHDLWKVTETLADDDDFLRHAVVQTDRMPLQVSADLRLRISRRLLVLGFPDAALIWAGPVRPDDTAERRLVLAEATLDIGDAPTARDLVEGLAGPEAAQIRAQALLQLGDMAAAAETLSASGQTDEASQANLWSGKWAALYPTTPDIWKNAAALTKSGEPDLESGVLGRGAEAIDASVTSRVAIETLLNTVVSPDGN